MYLGFLGSGFGEAGGLGFGLGGLVFRFKHVGCRV